MGRKGGFLSVVKKVVSCGSRQHREKKSRKRETWSSNLGTDGALGVHPPVEDMKLMEAEDEQNRHAYSVALATAVAAEAAVAAAQAAAEVVRLTSAACYTGRTKEELAAIRIQTAFRGYMARRALRALKGLMRLKSLIGAQSVKRQSETTLKYMQAMAHVQFEVSARRIRMLEEKSSSIQRQMQLKREKELEKQRLSIGENWDDTMQSKEKIEANLQSRLEAAIRRERALAYAYSHQQTWRNSTNSASKTFMDPNNPHWGWSWLERWMAARPWENGSIIDKDKDLNSDHASVKSTTSKLISIRGDKKTPSPKPRPPSRQSPSSPTSKLSGKVRPASSRGSANGKEEDSRSINSVQSERCRRHSIAGSSVRDDESLASCPPAAHGYMASTESARARSRPPSPLGAGKRGMSPMGSAKKRLSFSGSPDAPPRRHSGPPKINMSPVKDSAAKS